MKENEKDKIIELQRKKIEEMSKTINALEQEIFVLNNEKIETKESEM